MTVRTRDPGLCNFEAEWIWLFGDFSRTHSDRDLYWENDSLEIDSGQ